MYGQVREEVVVEMLEMTALKCVQAGDSGDTISQVSLLNCDPTFPQFLPPPSSQLADRRKSHLIIRGVSRPQSPTSVIVFQGKILIRKVNPPRSSLTCRGRSSSLPAF